MTVQSSTTTLRADARRNREAVISAARRLFAERGLDTPLEVIAQEAGVGRATMHRRFPTRESLVKTVFLDNISELERVSLTAADSADAYLDILAATLKMLVKDVGLVDVFNSRAVSDDTRKEISTRFLAIVEEPLRRAQAAGRVRSDLTLEDTTLLVDMLGGAAHSSGAASATERINRAHSLLLDAIRPTRNG
ncbi:TetR/AcrR family transcriptional regulator [Phytoactinopolyspora halotolerans]|uniref:TetR/AcrR family transcriptional regulator n=1 Tax=Phytoactinopolyspora halotolerans TaxID=1981512 RepID=A0A6L9SFY8_9ACTN|nr:TetR/AcrR family transcriptional regulator [Phytoactinopolyspora halotolerans]NEE02990.1 TetR/AcrR family transcriptional regulator [Phytoactinopolyspora halotolerans]